MLAEERFDNILKILAQRRSVTVQELCDALDASESTIRRDLVLLSQQGRLNRVHGGATLPDNAFLTNEESMAAKEHQAVTQKQSIGQMAAGFIQADDFVFVDAGSTTLQLICALQGQGLRATFVTNGIAHARLLAQKGCRVYTLGGQVRPNTEAVVGTAAMSSVGRYNFTKAFMGANGVSLDRGFTTPDVEEAALKTLAISRSMESWFLVDDSKFGKIYSAVICELTDAAIVTNRLPNEKYRRYVLIKESDASEQIISQEKESQV